MAARFNYPHGVAVLPDGAVAVSDGLNHVVRVVRPDGPLGCSVTTIAGQPGCRGADDAADGLSATFSCPFGLAHHPATNSLVLADMGNNSVRAVSLEPPHRVTTVAGGGRGGEADDDDDDDDGGDDDRNLAGYLDGVGADALFDSPSDIAVAGDGSVVVADSGNDAIRLIRGV